MARIVYGIRKLKPMENMRGIMMSEMTCQNCLSDFDEDDIVWANAEGQIGNGLTIFNNFAWCVSCLPAEGDNV